VEIKSLNEYSGLQCVNLVRRRKKHKLGSTLKAFFFGTKIRKIWKLLVPVP
jgi:hypothetical protein